jgi:hypothetical protein
MDPCGSDTRRYDMQCTCLSIFICHFWGPFFTFRQLLSIIFVKMAPKVTPGWPSSYIKSSQKCMDPVYGPVWTGHKAIWHALNMPFDVYLPLSGSIFHFPAIVFHNLYKIPPQSDSKLTSDLHKIIGKWIDLAYGPVWVGHKALWYAVHMPFDLYLPLLGSVFHFPAIAFHNLCENGSQSDTRLTLELYKIIAEMHGSRLWTSLNRTQSDMTCIKHAIRRLLATFGVHFSLSGHCLP